MESTGDPPVPLGNLPLFDLSSRSTNANPTREEIAPEELEKQSPDNNYSAKGAGFALKKGLI